MLTTEQTGFYAESGYVLLEDALEPDQLDALRRASASLIDETRALTESNDRFDLAEGHSADQPRLHRIKLPHRQRPVFWDVIRSPRMTAMLRTLVGPDVRLHTSKLNTKSPGAPTPVDWHQDWAFYPHTNDDMLAVGVMLDDVTEDNGPLQVIPGTHRGPVLDHFANGTFCGAVDPDDPDFDLSRAVTLTGRAGTVSVHHVRLLHGSSPNSSNRTRMMLFYECGAADAWPINASASAYTGMSRGAIWDELQARMICGTQPRTARLAPVPVTMPVPEAPDNSSIFQVQRSAGARSVYAQAGR